jgi:Family of unknown function (DUF6093)
MSRASVLARGRDAAEAGMVDACTIRRASGSGTTNPVTGYPTQAYTTLYTGKCRVQQAVAIARPHDVGEDRVYVVRFDLQLPMVGSEGLKVDDEVTITASVNDADLVGRVFVVLELAHKTEATARRVGMIERTAV